MPLAGLLELLTFVVIVCVGGWVGGWVGGCVCVCVCVCVFVTVGCTIFTRCVCDSQSIQILLKQRGSTTTSYDYVTET